MQHGVTHYGCYFFFHSRSGGLFDLLWEGEE